MFGIVDLSTTTRHCFLYGKDNDSKGADNVMSLVYNYLHDVASDFVRNCAHLVIFVDNCSGENKNKTAWAFLRMLVHSDDFRSLQKVTIFTMEVGHTKFSLIRVSGLCEEQKRNGI